MLRHAFKEWAVICKALAEGRQVLILRKGGILEAGAGFEVEYRRFWLFPTYTHQQSQGIVPAALPLLRKVENERPPADTIRLAHYAEAADVYQVLDLERALALAPMHFWSDDTVRQRFHYRRPGLFVLTLRIYEAAGAFELPNTPFYDGCRSWVELERELPTADSLPVLEESRWTKETEAIRRILGGKAESIR